MISPSMPGPGHHGARVRSSISTLFTTTQKHQIFVQNINCAAEKKHIPWLNQSEICIGHLIREMV